MHVHRPTSISFKVFNLTNMSLSDRGAIINRKCDLCLPISILTLQLFASLHSGRTNNTVVDLLVTVV